MSKMIPQETVDVMRKFVNVSVDIYGIDCELHIPTNLDTVEQYDVYQKPADFAYQTFNTLVWIEWAPNKHRLRKLGLFIEDETPMIAWFKYVEGLSDLDIKIGSWFTINPQYIPNDIDAEEFEVVDILVPGMHDAVITKMFKIAARRVKQ
jgi:hypothetical protein